MNRDYTTNSKIYCIRNHLDDDIYVGSTTQALSKRMAKHRENRFSPKNINLKFYQKLNELGVENFYIELLEEYPCENNDQLRAREGHFIREMATLNGRIEARNKHEWYQDNKEHVKEKAKQDYHNNIETRREQRKEYRDQRKEQRVEYDKQYRQENKERIAQYKKDYHERNREEIYRNTKNIMNNIKKSKTKSDVNSTKSIRKK